MAEIAIIEIPINDLRNPPTIKFPDRCVNCGNSKAETLFMTLNLGVQKRSKPVALKLSVPMCKACADKERSIAKVTFIPFLIAGVIFGIIAFVPVVLIAPEGTTAQTLNQPWILGGAAGLVMGVAGGTLIEVITRFLAVPFYGKLVIRRPLTVLAIFTEADQLIGISAKFLREKKLVQLEFENEEIAREFIQLNPLEKK